jgi:anion-transporting  ArsA/GET3 family ATPase
MENQKILMVTGKGGVGKSTVAAAAAFRLAQSGRKVLLAELGEKSFYQDVFNQAVRHEPSMVRENLWVCRWEGEDCLKEYLAHLIKLEKIVNLFFENKVMKALVQAAPALKELAIVGKLTSGRRKVGPSLPFDYVIMDAYSTGHFKALIQAPKGMGEAIPLGPMGEQCRSIERVLHDPAATRIWVVSLPEELPVTESMELTEFLKDEMHLEPKVVLNRVLPVELDENDCLRAGAGEADFLAYLCDKTEQLRQARQALGALVVEELPMELSPLSLQMIENLAEKLELPWTS